MVQIKIKSRWATNIPKEYEIGSVLSATLHQCDGAKDYDECYAVLKNDYVIPHGNFDILGPKRPKAIPISQAKQIAKESGYDEVIIVGCNYETGIQHVTTYGKSTSACENAAKGGNAIKNLLGWHPEKCNDKPARSKDRQPKNPPIIPGKIQFA